MKTKPILILIFLLLTGCADLPERLFFSVVATGAVICDTVFPYHEKESSPTPTPTPQKKVTHKD